MRTCVSRVFRSTMVMRHAPGSRRELLRYRARIERARIQRHPDHCCSDAAIRELTQIVHARDSAGCDDGMHRQLGDILHEKEIGAREPTLTMNGGDEHSTKRD